MSKREFLQLAHVFDPDKHLAAGAFVSEKLDGFRCFWDGGVSRGLPKGQVPWANLDKDERYQSQQYATGLWSRYGNTIHAPDFWLNELPKFPLDGELWMGRGTFQQLRSIAAKLPENRIDHQWEDIQFKVFDIPSVEAVFASGKINVTNFKKEIPENAVDWVRERGLIVPRPRTFTGVLAYLDKNLVGSTYVSLHKQIQLPFSTEKALIKVTELLDSVTDNGGEGLILRRPQSIWTPSRTHDLVKVKKLQDDEATVVGYVTGRKTERGSKLLGLMGAMIVNWRGVRFELSGFTDEERVLSSSEERIHISQIRNDDLKDMMVEPKAFRWCMANYSPDNGPGVQVPDWIVNQSFPRGSTVTFRYRELSDDNVPKEARFWRGG